jgi:diguanylate cyclase (GGDEF)-like protein
MVFAVFSIILVVIAIFLWHFIYSKRKIKGLENTLHREQKVRRQLAVLNDITSVLATNLDIESIVETLIGRARYLVRAELSALILFKKDTVTGFFSSISSSSDCKNTARGIIGRVLNEGLPIRTKDIRGIEGFKGFPSGHPDIKNILAVPIILGEEIIGELMLANRTGIDEFSEEDEDLLLTLAFHAALAIEKANLHEEVVRLASTDSLTGLNNHRVFHERLDMEVKRAERFGRELSLLMLDIDYFKRFNDTYGHIYGDEILERIACIMSENIRDNIDSAARYGGEEFTIILPETQLEGAMKTAERIREKIENHKIKVDGKQAGVTISIGVAIYPDDAKGKEDLIGKADKALYLAKRIGRNRVCSFSDMS